jgi:hypothetical protein
VHVLQSLHLTLNFNHVYPNSSVFLLQFPVPGVQPILYSSSLNLQSLELIPHILQDADWAGARLSSASVHDGAMFKEGTESKLVEAMGGGEGEEIKVTRVIMINRRSELESESGGRPL